jgi:oxygen-independent coproporphyrinogen-3 oxidase
MDFGVYIHVPFCRVQCPYCTFYTVLRPQQEAPMRDFVDAVAREWRLRVSPRLERGDRLRTLYLGGGTPSDLPTAALLQQLRHWDEELSRRSARRLGELDEITIECNPESTGPALLDGLVGLGVHRVSLGVQALVDEDLQVLGRAADRTTVRHAVQQVAQRFRNWNADWLIGVPRSDWTRLRSGLEEVAAAGAPHLSFYCLEMPPTQARKLGDIPGQAGDARKADLYVRTSEWAEAHGYEHYEISNAALAGWHAVHNQAYWDGRDYVGLGPGAHSLEAGVRRANRADLQRWRQALQRGEDPPHHEERLTDAMRHHEAVLLGLRRRRGVPLERLGPDTPRAFLARLIEEGLAQLEGDTLRLTPRGWLISDSIVLQLVAA